MAKLILTNEVAGLGSAGDVIEVKNGFNPDAVLDELYRLTPLEDSFGINNVSGATGRTATVQVSTSSGGVLSSKSLDVGAVRGSSGNNAPIPVVKLVVSKDAATGAFDFLAQ